MMSHAVGNDRVGTEIPAPRAMVGYVSRQLSRIELGSIINLPVQSFLRSWIRLDGQLPSVAAVAEGFTSAGLPAAVNLLWRPVVREELTYTLTQADHDVACRLGQDLKNHPEVLDMREYSMSNVARGAYELAKASRTQFRAGNARTVRLHLYHGCPGSGKSYAANQWLQQVHARTPFTNANFRAHTWLNSLRGPLEQTLSATMPFLQSFNFQTGAMPLAQPLPGTILFDDATQLWPGFLPLVIASNPGLTDVVVTFDATQGRTAFPHADSLVRSDQSTAEWLSALSSHYATESWRLSNSNATLFGLPLPASPRPGSLNGILAVVSNVIQDIPLLVVSPRFATSQADSGQRCMTFRECQGFTIDGDVTLDLGGLSATSNDNSWWTALTRARGNIMLYLGPMTQGKGINEAFYGRSNIASALLAVVAQQQCSVLTANVDPMRLVARAVQAHMARSLSPAACLSVGLPRASPLVGANVSASIRQDWLDSPRDSALGDYWTARSHRATLKGYKSAPGPAFSRHSHAPANLATDVRDSLKHFVSLPNDSVLHTQSTGYVMPDAPVLTLQPDPALFHSGMRDPDFREVVRGTNSTMQHVHDGPHEILHHTRADRLTASISEQKRINVGVDWGHLSLGEARRLKQLKRGFGKFFNVSAWNEQSWSPNLFEHCSTEAYSPWVGKRTKAQIARSLAKNPLDSACNFAHLFLKSQFVKKEEARYADAKAGQTVSEFNLVRQFRDAPYAYYLEHMAMKYKKDGTYLHLRASPTDMNNWYKAHWRKGEMTANDYTAWDSGCDRVFLAFDCWLMEMSGLPGEYIALWRAERLTTHSYLGPHKVRQESGDRYTFIFNSLRNAAITGASLRCPPGTSAAFAGDDSVVLGTWLRANGFVPDAWAMTPKLEFGKNLLFCGYAFGGTNISLSPTVVMHRSQYGMALGRNDPDYWRSIADAVKEASVTAPDYSTELSSAVSNLVTASIKFGFTVTRNLHVY